MRGIGFNVRDPTMCLGCRSVLLTSRRSSTPLVVSEICVGPSSASGLIAGYAIRHSGEWRNWGPCRNKRWPTQAAFITCCGISEQRRHRGGEHGFTASFADSPQRNGALVSDASLALQQQLSRLTLLMRIHAGPAKARLRSFAFDGPNLESQAQLWAYVDVFDYLAVMGGPAASPCSS